MEHEHHHHSEHHTHSDKKDFSIPASIIVGAILVSASVFYNAKLIIRELGGGNLKGLSQNQAQAPGAPGGSQAPVPQADSGPVQVSMDDDPVMGSKNAPLTVIEFSDYECPFCKRSFSDVIPNLKKDYIDTGKVKLVYRDFPLSFHQNAQKEAEASECARVQGGDAVYFKFHDQIFTKTTSNGTGLALEQLPVIAKDLGLNVNQFQQCLDSGKYKDEVAKDIADGAAAGVSGTPTWFIGKTTSNGTIDGTRIVGAQPYAAFKTVIDQQLK